MTDEKFNSTIDFVAQQAFGDPCTGSNPRQTSPEDLKKILICCLDGKKVDF